MFDGSSGKIMYQLYDPESSGIMSVRPGPSNNKWEEAGIEPHGSKMTNYSSHALLLLPPLPPHAHPLVSAAQ